MWRKFVEEDHCGEWSVACLPIREPKLALVAAELQQDMFAIVTCSVSD